LSLRLYPFSLLSPFRPKELRGSAGEFTRIPPWTRPHFFAFYRISGKSSFLGDPSIVPLSLLDIFFSLQNLSRSHGQMRQCCSMNSLRAPRVLFHVSFSLLMIPLFWLCFCFFFARHFIFCSRADPIIAVFFRPSSSSPESLSPFTVGRFFLYFRLSPLSGNGFTTVLPDRRTPPFPNHRKSSPPFPDVTTLARRRTNSSSAPAPLTRRLFLRLLHNFFSSPPPQVPPFFP